MRAKIARTVLLTVVCVLLGILIALQMKNVNADQVSESNLEELQAKLIDYAAKNAELSDRNAELYQYISLLEDDQASGSVQIDSILREKERAAIFAGLREVRNAGIEITVTVAEGAMIRDSVLRQFVNELRALGAQAISINSERLVATSEIRASGSVILINGNGYNRQAGFQIKAITDPAKDSFNLEYLDAVRQSVIHDPQFAGDGYQIQISPMPEITIPALSEDSIAFKIDLLMPDQQE